MTELTYVPKAGFAAPGNGWPAADHEEPNEEVAQEKVNSGFYVSDGLEPQELEEPTNEAPEDGTASESAPSASDEAPCTLWGHETHTAANCPDQNQGGN